MYHDVSKNMVYWSQLFSRILLHHLLNETEVNIKEGTLSQESLDALGKLGTEMHLLQYRNRITAIYAPWCLILKGQPNKTGISTLIDNLKVEVINKFELHLLNIQDVARRFWFHRDNQMSRNICSSTHEIVNFTDHEIPYGLKKLLTHGTNFVPLIARDNIDIVTNVENDLKNAAIKFFRSRNNFYPLINEKSKLSIIVSQLMQQTQSGCPSINFYVELYENYVQEVDPFLSKIDKSSSHDYSQIKSLIPNGTVISIADKGLGPCLLPEEWYLQQYIRQAKIGGHKKANISEDKCLQVMLQNIQIFRVNLESGERDALKKYYQKCSPIFRVGCLKLIPKIHKLVTPIDSNSWKKLPARPIRGGEACPINSYSKTLCKMLQELHSKIKQLYIDGKFGTSQSFPIILGCDEYATKITGFNYPKESWGDITLVSGDFSDAYTKSSLMDLQNAIKKLGLLVGWDQSLIGLSLKLACLVFENCYFVTPAGVMQQLNGFPMGGHCSREGLDTILLSSEIEICKNSNGSILQYVRLVDDISLVVKGCFNDVRDMLIKMSIHYPNTMPLNIQISFGLSRYLDVRVSKELQNHPNNTLTLTLAYKALSTFNVVPFVSNIAPRYKGSIVSNYLHRIYGRCSLNSGRSHHLSFMLKVLKHRGQDMDVVRAKYRKFQVKRLQNTVKQKPNSHGIGLASLIHYDDSNDSHVFVGGVLKNAYKSINEVMPPIIYLSLPKIIGMLTTKRSVIRQISKLYE